MRIVIALVIVGAVMFMAGLLLVVVGVALQTVGKHPDTQTIGLGAEVAVAGFSFGMIVLAILVLLRGGITGAGISRSQGRGRPGQYRPAMAAAGAGGRTRAGLNDQAGGDGPAYAGAGTRTGAGFIPSAHPGRGGPRPASNGGRNQRGREQVLNPSSVMTPGGLLDMPGSTPRGFAQDRAAAGQPAGPDGYWPGAGSMPGAGQGGPRGAQNGTRPAQAGSRQDQAGPHPGSAGPNPAHGGKRPAQAGQQPAQPGQRSAQAGQPGQYPGQAGQQGRMPGDAGRRQPGAAGQGGAGQAGSGQPGAGQAGGPSQGHPQAGGPRAGFAHGTAAEGPGATAEPEVTGFDVFAKAKPSPSAPDMYVYRDTGEPEEPEQPVTAAKPETDEQEAAYWYGVAEPEQPAPDEEVRGPFEPLVVSSAAPATEPAGEPEEQEDPAGQHERKLEQIKDFYLTAEAIGEDNVDKHFDVLLAQQRELISEYFKQTGLRRAPEQETDGTAPAEAAPT